MESPFVINSIRKRGGVEPLLISQKKKENFSFKIGEAFGKYLKRF